MIPGPVSTPRTCRPDSGLLRASALGLSALVVLSACSDSSSDAFENGPGPDSGNRSRLTTFDSGEDFMTAVREALLAQGQFGGDPGGQPESIAGGDIVTDDVAFVDAEASAPAASGDSADSAADADDVTGTNVQEIGVDEADRVKTDGQRLYVLQSRYDGYIDDTVDVEIEPVAVDGTSMPAPESADATVLRVLEMDRDTPDAVPLADITIDLGGRYADGFYLTGGQSTSAVLVSEGFGGYNTWDDSMSFSGADTLVARVPLADPATASVDATLLMDGRVVSSRRIDNQLFLASRFYPVLDGVDPYSVDPDTWAAAVAGASDEDLLPSWTDTSGNRQTLIDPSACFVAAPSDGEQPITADIVVLSVIDLDTLQPLDSECFLGASETLYASPEAVFLATTQWTYSHNVQEDELVDTDVISTDAVIQDPRVDTDIHQFDINDSGLNYVGSGRIEGHLGWNHNQKPYRFSEYNGDLRVVSMPAMLDYDSSPIIMSVLRSNGQGELVTVAQLPNDARPAPIGKPFEQLYASRFLGDRAYLVTFRQTDPLYVIDLSNPSDPAILGELEITGYSEWLLPMGNDHLLGLGKDAVPVEDGQGDGRGGLFQGIKLSLFDVSDPTAPREVSTQRIGERGTESIALYNPRAITVQAATDEHPVRIAMGIDVHGSAVSPPLDTISDPWQWRDWSYTGLHGFDVRTGSDARIEARGALVVETASAGQYGPRAGQDRSVLAGDAAFYIHGSRVHAAPWDNLANGGAGR